MVDWVGVGDVEASAAAGAADVLMTRPRPAKAKVLMRRRRSIVSRLEMESEVRAVLNRFLSLGRRCDVI